VTQDHAKAAHWYRKAAEQGDAKAQFNLGVAYEYGEGVKKDLTAALHWFRLAAAQGDADAAVRVRSVELELEAAPQTAHATGGASPDVCGNCGLVEGSGGIILKPCSRCKAVKYCGTVCQSQHWKAPGRHKTSCKTAGS
jgi:TPR repeat protein